jgi:cobalt/nickel transport protein
MKMDKLQKRILLVLLLLCIITPMGILLPMLFNAGDAWGEWSAKTLKDLIGYVPQGLAKYDELWNAPLPDYAIKGNDPSIFHQSGYYIVSGLFGATVTFLVMIIISRLILRNEK